jgi:hypothetical protein
VSFIVMIDIVLTASAACAEAPKAAPNNALMIAI